MFKRLTTVIVLTSLISCTSGGGGGSSDGACATLAGKVTNGETCDRSTDNPVALIIITSQEGQPQGICSGAFLTSTKVLTAAHCLSQNARYLVNVNGNVFPVIKAVPHPDFDGQTIPDQEDVAILTLAAPQPVNPISLLVSRSTDVGDKITVYGYGQDENGLSAGDKDPDESLKAGRMEVTNILGGVIEARFEGTDSSACFGDSGGPVVLSKDGVTGITGIVNSGNVGDCLSGSTVFFTDILHVLDFVLSEAAQAGAV